MVDEEAATGGGATALICPWCSATYTGERETCPSCGAALAADPTADSSLPGLTAIDADAIVRAKTPVARPRNRLLSWISGEYPDQGGAVAEAGALAPPDLAVRREILRLELEAEVANLQAEADALRAEAAAEGRSDEVEALDAAIAAAASAADPTAATDDAATDDAATDDELSDATDSKDDPAAG